MNLRQPVRQTVPQIPLPYQTHLTSSGSCRNGSTRPNAPGSISAGNASSAVHRSAPSMDLHTTSSAQRALNSPFRAGVQLGKLPSCAPEASGQRAGE